MSAYVCNPEHFGILAAYAVEKRCIIYPWQLSNQTNVLAVRIANAQNVAKLLARENIRSVAHRYPNDKDAEIEEAAAIYAAHFVTNPQRLTPVQVLTLCQGYGYQASETDDWRTTDAELQLDWIQNSAIRDLPGYDDAEWSFDQPLSEIEALYA